MSVERRHLLSLLAASAATPLWAQGFAGLEQSPEGFALPSPETRLRFPRDHGPHPTFRIEWWYLTANLTGPDGTPYGVQWTLFRSALAPETRPGWADPQIWFAHAAITRPDRHLVAERRARGGIGQAGVTLAPFTAWIDDWHMQSHAAPGADPLNAITLSARGQDWRYSFTATTQAPLVLHGQAGYSRKHERGQSSHYYSQPAYTVQGQIHWPDGPVPVTGVAWLDREWSSQPLDPDQTGWDWFALHLDSGAKLMVYQLRDAEGGGTIPGTWIAPDGRAEALPDGAIRLTPLAWTEIGSRRLPIRWRIDIAAHTETLTIDAINPQAWMGTGIAYWEGPVTVRGTSTGRGYLEMTGYE